MGEKSASLRTGPVLASVYSAGCIVVSVPDIRAAGVRCQKERGQMPAEVSLPVGRPEDGA